MQGVRDAVKTGRVIDVATASIFRPPRILTKWARAPGHADAISHGLRPGSHAFFNPVLQRTQRIPRSLKHRTDRMPKPGYFIEAQELTHLRRTHSGLNACVILLCRARADQ